MTDGTGKIFSLDMQDPRMKPVELRMPRNFDLESFNPHGISVYTDETGKSAHRSRVLHNSHAYVCKIVEPDRYIGSPTLLIDIGISTYAINCIFWF